MELSLLENFGSNLADGSAAYAFRTTRIDPYVSMCDTIVLDFSNVRNANSSFMNALITGLLVHHDVSVLNKLHFKGCNPVIKVLVGAAVDLAFQKVGSKIAA